MKPRILKKLSKKAHAIFAASPRRDFQSDAKRVWIDDEFATDWARQAGSSESGKKERLHRQGKVSVNHVPSIGGEYDSYAGEGTDFYPLYEWAANYVLMSSMQWEDFDDMGECGWPESNIKGRLTGKKVIERLREAAQELDA
ncbi:hypothetical protein [Halomonas sp. BMC6]|uniref:hypothetical protein n=1 Tax=Halomonas sp. BMC6 TaxID=3073244 RepID=UPI0030CDC9F6